MIVGFNHNISYRGTIFHVQTEDSGLKNPQLVTLLYHGGIIISSKKTLYDDIVKVDNLDQVVEQLAKEQHKGMLKRLTAGVFDERIVELKIPVDARPAKAAAGPVAGSVISESVAVSGPPPAVKHALPKMAAAEFVSDQPGSDVIITEEPIVDRLRNKAPQTMNLDELILAYLTVGCE
jgi:hypothetical protein